MSQRNIAEDTLLAHIVFSPNFYLLRANELPEDIFTQPNNKVVYIAFLKVLQNGDKPDAITISKQMEEPDAFDIVTGILSGYDMYADIENITTFVIDAYKERKLLDGLYSASQIAKEDGWQQAVKHLSNTILQINQTNSDELVSIEHDFKEMFELIEKNKLSNGLTGTGTGLKKYDEFSSGLQPSDLVIFAGRTSQGKTSLALTIARNASIDFNTPVALFSLEMSKVQITSRVAALESGISSKDILMGKIDDVRLEKLKSSLGKISNARLFVDKCRSTKLQYIISKMMSYILQKGVRVFIVDYLQLVSNVTKGKNREQEVGEVARVFKNFALEHNVCVVALSQLNRPAIKSNSEPNLADLRDSGQIEEAADVVMFVYRPEYYGVETFEDGTSTQGKAEIIIAKGRNIGVAKFRLDFIHHITRFVNEGQYDYAQHKITDYAF